MRGEMAVRFFLHPSHSATGEQCPRPLPASEITPELADAAPGSEDVRVEAKIEGACMVAAQVPGGGDATSETWSLPLMLAQVTRIGKVGVKLTPFSSEERETGAEKHPAAATTETTFPSTSFFSSGSASMWSSWDLPSPVSPPPPADGPRGFRRRRMSPVLIDAPMQPAASAAPATAWLLLAEGPAQRERLYAALGAAGALRDDFEKEYQLQQACLGCGASADVHRATALRGGPAVAVKCLQSLRHQSDEAALKQELSVLAALQDHPNLVKFHGAFVRTRPLPIAGVEVSYCLAMELCVGSVFDRLSVKPYSEADAKPVVRDILAGLAKMHRHRFVHRDLKLENVLLRRDGTAVLADFGLSCSADDSVEVTRICGSPGFMAPEIVEKQGACLRSDVWSAGAVVYMMLTESLPFGGRDVSSTLRKCVAGKVNFQHAAFERVSDECQELIAGMLASAAADRPDAADALRSDWLGHIDFAKARTEPNVPLLARPPAEAPPAAGVAPRRRGLFGQRAAGAAEHVGASLQGLRSPRGSFSPRPPLADGRAEPRGAALVLSPPGTIRGPIDAWLCQPRGEALPAPRPVAAMDSEFDSEGASAPTAPMLRPEAYNSMLRTAIALPPFLRGRRMHLPL